MEIVKNNRYEVLTVDGFKDFDGFKISSQKTVKLIFNDGGGLECTEDHLIHDSNSNTWVEAIKLSIGTSIRGNVENKILISRTECDEQKVVDLVNVKDVNSFFANGINVHNCIFLDELAFVSPRIADEFWVSLLPSITAGGTESSAKLIITSTPNGSEGLFASLWFGAEQGVNGFTPIRVYNNEVKGRAANFRAKMIQKMSEEKLSQEYECAFISTSGTLINSSFLESLQTIEPILKRYDIEIFNSIENKRLGISVDVGTGVGQDYSVVQIFDLDTFEQLGQYRNNSMSLTDFTKHLLKILTYLKKEAKAKEIYYTVESNSIGQGVLTLIENSKNSILKEVEFVNDSSVRSGMLTTSKTKMKGALKFKDLLESGRMKIHSRKLLSELRFFIKSGATFKATPGMHDDLVMGCIVLVNMLVNIGNYDADIYDKIINTGVELEIEGNEEEP